MTQTPAKPDDLVILVSARKVLWPLSAISPFLVFIFVKTFSVKALVRNLDPGEIFFGAMIVLCGLWYFVDFILGGGSRRFLLINAKGILVAGPKATWIPWRWIEDCACDSAGARAQLTLVLRPGLQAGEPSAAASVAHVLGLAKRPANQSGRVDIDFAPTQDPQRSLERALQSCRAWIAATREEGSAPAAAVGSGPRPLQGETPGLA